MAQRGLQLADSDVESEEEYIPEETEEDKRLESFVTAVKNGFIKTVREVLDTEEGVALLERKDKEGHTPLHWACLGGYNEIVELLLEKGSALNEHSDNDYGPKPIHWACVKGHVVTVNLLIEKGVHIDTTDLNGCNPLIVAAQYGQSLVVSYLLQKGANRFHTDVDNDTALHWACYKGYPEVVFLLLNAGLDVKQKDSFGQTPMHSCCIKGDLQIAEMLIEQGANLDEEDSKGNTPRMLAKKRRHRRLLQLFDYKDIPTDIWDWRVWVFGPPSRSRYAFVFFILAIILWGYPLYYFVAVPYTVELIPKTHTLFWISNIIMWALFIYLKTVNPGYIPPNLEAYEKAQKMVGDPTSWGDYDDLHNPVYNMCHTCKTVRPIRSKHCRQCDKCVENFDHHCPWIDNCVSRANRVPFFFFVHSMLINGMITYLMVYLVLKGGGSGFFVWCGIVALVFFSIPVVFMLGYTYMLMILNMTTNERANYKRYRYFKDGHGKFRNPFSRGVFYNILEYFNIIDPVNVRNRSGNTYVV